MVNKILIDAVNVTQHCQRNWDYSSIIPHEDLSTLITVATSMPTKQNLSYFKLVASLDKEFNRFCFENSIDPNNKKSKGRNFQVNAPLLFFWCYDPKTLDDCKKLPVFDDSLPKNFDNSIMISLGGTALAAAQLGYRTGFCQCALHDPINKKLKEKFKKDLHFSGTFLGVGKPNPNAKYWYEILNDQGLVEHTVQPEPRKGIEIYKI